MDHTPPAFEEPDEVVAEATSAAGAVVSYEPPAATDNLDPAPDVGCLPAPGSLFALGTTSVSCSVTDAAGNEGDAVEFDVHVRDTTAPTLDPFADIVVAQNAPGGANVAYDPWPTASDAVDGTLDAECAPDAPVGSPRFFALADSPVPVSCGAEDAEGNALAPTLLFHVIVNAGPAPPVPSITARPPAVSNDPTAAFAFDAEGDVETTCRLDGPSASPAEPCDGVQEYAGLVDGAYLFTVESEDTTIETVSQATWAFEVDTAPPASVASFAGRGGVGRVTLSWKRPQDEDYARVRISRQRPGGAWRLLASRVTATSFTDTRATNEVVFRYRIQSYDDAGNAVRPGVHDGAGQPCVRAAVRRGRESAAARRLGARREGRLLQRAALAGRTEGHERLADGLAAPPRLVVAPRGTARAHAARPVHGLRLAGLRCEVGGPLRRSPRLDDVRGAALDGSSPAAAGSLVPVAADAEQQPVVLFGEELVQEPPLPALLAEAQRHLRELRERYGDVLPADERFDLLSEALDELETALASVRAARERLVADRDAADARLRPLARPAPDGRARARRREAG